MKKKKILFQSDFALVKTGFGRNAKAILTYLYRTGKYDIVQYSCGMPYSHPAFSKTPWKTVGALPNSAEEIKNLNKNPHDAKLASYGAYYIDKVIQEEKPDIYIAAQDIWGVDFAIEKQWFNKINSVIWTTLDSLPILPSAIEAAKKSENFWVWSSFATKAMHQLGLNHVKTVHGAVDDGTFFRQSDEEKLNLRNKFGIDKDAFIIGFVFRNQLRKSVPNLLEGYKLWKISNPEAKNSRLLLHTDFNEGWGIKKLAEEYGISEGEILTSYICKECKSFEVKPFSRQDLECPTCEAKKSQGTTNVALGITEDQLNEVYNLMDVYCHPFTSGGQEIPIQEAKFAELITLVTNYSCGEEMCEEGSASLPLSWSEYREIGTDFKKASTLPSSIAEQLNKVYQMTPDERKILGEKGREWAIKNYSIYNVGYSIETLLDNFPDIDYSFEIKTEEKDPYCQIENIQDNEAWILSLYKNILKKENDNEGLKYWSLELSKGAERKEIEKFFRQAAANENAKNKKIDFSSLLDEKDNKRLLVILPKSIGDIFLASSLFESLRKRYPRPEWAFYFACDPEHFEVLEGNPHIDKILAYFPRMDDSAWLEGVGAHEGYFEVVYPLHFPTQRLLSYTHNGVDKIDLEIKCT